MNRVDLAADRSIIDNGVNIVCGTRYLQQDPSDFTFIDNRFPDMDRVLPGVDESTDDPCSESMQAFGFPTGLTGSNEPSYIIVLCDGENGGLADELTINEAAWNGDWSHVADDRISTTAIEVAAEFISATILHELLHFVQPQRKSIYYHVRTITS